VARRHNRNVEKIKLEVKAHLQEVNVGGTSISCVRTSAGFIWLSKGTREHEVYTPRSGPTCGSKVSLFPRSAAHLGHSLTVYSPKGQTAYPPTSPPVCYVTVCRAKILLVSS
jgi:hypothetical protein